MELRDAILGRRSIRAYRPDPIPEARLEDLLTLANWAPSAGNLQSRDFVVVRDEGLRAGVARAAQDQEFLAEAPVVVVACGNAGRVEGRYGARGRDLYMIQDSAAALQNYMLAAHEAKLGTVWVGAFDEDAVRRLLHLPPTARPLALIGTGKPAEHPEPREHLPLSELVHWDQW